MKTDNKKHLFNWYTGNFMNSLTLFGMPLFYLFLVLTLSQFDYVKAEYLMLLLISVELISWSIKFFYKKERPQPQSRENFIESLDANSFPSIHTARISALAVFFWVIYNNALFDLMGLYLILGVGWSRIYLKKHYVIDVIGGFMIGASLAFMWSLNMVLV